jgi:hypothetical protein
MLSEQSGSLLARISRSRVESSTVYEDSDVAPSGHCLLPFIPSPRSTSEL